LDIIVQVILVLVTSVTSYFIVREMFGSTLYAWFGAVAGVMFGYLIIKVEEKLREIPLKNLIGTLVGITIGLFVANLLISKLLLTHAKDVPITLPIYVLLYFVLGYLGFRIGEKKSHTSISRKYPSSTAWRNLRATRFSIQARSSTAA